jgi:hypothetical protein
MIRDANASLIEANLPSPVFRIGMGVVRNMKSVSIDTAGMLLLRPGWHNSSKQIEG